MTQRTDLTRRAFLRATALAAGGTMLAACGGTAPEPQGGATPASPDGAPASSPVPAGPEPTVASGVGQSTPVTGSSEYAEAPTLAARVEAGDLPPVAERLPTKPYVVPHQWLERGKYGGRMRMACNDVWGMSHFMQESMYGHSPVRWLDDGLRIGAGLAESWESNEEQTEWTFHFREGLRWSDGEPWTTADVMYWWEDMVLNEDHPTGLPDELRSSRGTAATLRAPDDTTLTIRYDAPAPLTPDLVACWVKRGIGPADWMQPKHYLQQFHPTYNPKLKGEAAWADEHEAKKDFAMNPECPTMTGWMLASYREGRQSEWVRNPYYWVVTRDGDQLPYIDSVTYAYVQNAEVLKLQFTQGQVDYVHGGHEPISLADVAEFKRSEERSGLETLLWDSGSGTGSIFFLSQDYEEPEHRALFRNPAFRQAISHAYNREEVFRSIYFNQGELTTGTMSPKSIEYRFNDEAKQRYAEWRDSYIAYDPERAKRMLDELELEPAPNGMRRLPNGSQLRLRLEYGAPGDQEHVRKNQLLARDLKAVGIDAVLSPVPSDSFGDRWAAGKLMTTTAWEASDGPNSLVNPTWLVPLEPSRWAPLQGTFYSLRGTPQEKQELDKDPYERTPPRMDAEEGGPIERLWQIYDRSKAETDQMTRNRLVWDIMKVHVEDGPFFMGVVANYPRIVLVRKGLMNVPRREDLPLNGYVNTWIHPTPAVYDWEAYYWDDPQAHTS